jgi:hypothetical protein
MGSRNSKAGKEVVKDSPASSPRAPDQGDLLDSISESNAQALDEELVRGLIERRDLPAEAMEQIGRHPGLAREPKLRLAFVEHPRAPRRMVLPLLRHLFTFELMKVTIAPALAPELKLAAEQALLRRLETSPIGERVSLARRASARVAAALLVDAEAQVLDAALENHRLTEAGLIGAIRSSNASAELVERVCRHPKWSPRREIRIALAQNEKTPVAWALRFAADLPESLRAEMVEASALSAERKALLARPLSDRETGE